jgi:hypothetical protein
MVIKTQIKQKKSKSQLRKTLKHYSKTNKKGGRWGRKSTKKVHEIPFVPNPFSYNHERIRTNPLHILNNNNYQYNSKNNNNLPDGFGVEETTYNNSGYNNSQSLFSGRSSNGYISLGSQNFTNNEMNPLYTQMNPLYTQKNPIYNDLSTNSTVGEAKLRKQINNGNLLKGTAKA